MSLAIAGLGTAVPAHQMSQQEALELHLKIVCQDERHRRLTKVLFKKSGVSRRHTVVPHTLAYEYTTPDSEGGTFAGPTTRQRMEMYSQFAPPLAAAACNQAFQGSDVAAADITHLVVVSCTGFDSPGVDVALIKGLGLARTTQRINVGFMGCHGAINGLRVASGLVAEDPHAKVLLVAVECCSLHYRFTWNQQGIVGNAIFADGAAALIACRKATHQPELLKTGSCLIEDSESAMSWRVGNRGFEMRLSPEIGDHIQENLRGWLEEWLGDQGLKFNDISRFLVHPGGPKILSAVESALQLSPADIQVSYDILRDYGNMSSPTILFALERALAEKTAGPTLALGFGPGLMAEVALLNL